MSDRFPFFDPYFRENGPFSFFGRDMSLDPKPDAGPEGPLQPVAERLGDDPHPSDDDVNALARMIFGEGAGLYRVPGAMEGIGWVARNRVGAPGHPKTLQSVITQPHQFQAVRTDGQRGNDEWQRSVDPSQLTGPDVPAYQRAQEVARGILSGDIPDPTGGAMFFGSHHKPPPQGGDYPPPNGYVSTVPPIGAPGPGYFSFLKLKPARSP